MASNRNGLGITRKATGQSNSTAAGGQLGGKSLEPSVSRAGFSVPNAHQSHLLTFYYDYFLKILYYSLQNFLK